MTQPVASEEERIKKFADNYAKERNDDCLCQRTRPDTPVGEHIYIFCGCDLHEASIKAAHFGIKLEREKTHKDRPHLHYCPNWDEMRIDRHDPEFDVCNCFKPKPSCSFTELKESRYKLQISEEVIASMEEALERIPEWSSASDNAWFCPTIIKHANKALEKLKAWRDGK